MKRGSRARRSPGAQHGHSIDASLPPQRVAAFWLFCLALRHPSSLCDFLITFGWSFGRASSDPEIRYRRKDGSEFWASVRISPVQDRSGEVVQHFVSLIDITKQKKDQHHSRMLIDELNHLKSTLATVQSIVHQSLRSGSDLKAIGEAVDSRLSALGRSHDLLTQQKREGAGLLDMVNATLKPFIPQGQAERFDATGENIRIPPTAVLALNITFHELVTNAVKYGSFSNDIGHVSIGWKIVTASEGDRLHLHWRETEGPTVSRPTHRGLGSVIIESGLAYQLNGVVKLDFPVEGVVCTIVFLRRQFLIVGD